MILINLEALKYFLNNHENKNINLFINKKLLLNAVRDFSNSN